MPRRRMLDPEIWRNPDFATLSLLAKLLFIGIFSHADDEGRLEAEPVGLKIKIFPANSQDITQIGEAIKELQSKQMIELYEVDEKQYLFIPKWFKHQYIPKPSPSDYPLPPKELIEKHPSYHTGIVDIYEKFKYSKEKIQNQYSINIKLIQEWYGSSIGTVSEQSGSGRTQKGKERNIKEKNINTNALNDKKPSRSEPSSKNIPQITFNFEKRKWENITDEDKKGWKEAYPACDITIELAKMADWLLSNPKKRKKNYRSFITNWLSRQQDRGGTKVRKLPKEPIPAYHRRIDDE